MMLDLNEAENWERDQVTAAAEAQEAKNRRRLGAAGVIVLTCLVLCLVGKSTIPRRPNGLFSPRQLLGLKDNKCAGITCSNGAFCDGNTGKCICPAGMTGANCDISDVVDICTNTVCLNGGACNINTGLCDCPAGFSGANCQIGGGTNPDTCDGVICFNGGVCNPGNGECVCSTEYDGDQCEDFVGKCADVTCLNGGTCDKDTGICDCLSGFTGDICQTTVPVKFVFITSNVWNGNLGRLVGADAKCQAAANGGALDGNFKAWLSDSKESAIDRITHSTEAYILPDHTTVANDWKDLINVDLDHAINMDENGNTINKRVWTGTDEHGNQHDGYCNDWTSSGADLNDENDLGLTGVSYAVHDDWTDDKDYTCNKKYHLYCFQV